MLFDQINLDSLLIKKLEVVPLVKYFQKLINKLDKIKHYREEMYSYKILLVGIPSAYWVGTEGEYYILMMELLGSNLEDLFNNCKRHFSLKTVLIMAQQRLSRIEFIHSKNLIHRDVKPDNFLLNQLKRVIPFILQILVYLKSIEIKELIFTSLIEKYASTNTHLGVEQSRRDDLEAIGYVLVYFLNGQLLWQSVKTDNKKDKYEKIAESNIATSNDKLCEGLPKEFSIYFNYCKNLKFGERPHCVLFKRIIERSLYKNEISK